MSGITNGRRAEWSVYVEDDRGRPRYLVIDARASGRSMDPVDVITPASRVDHRRVGDEVSMMIGPEGSTFEASFTVPADAARVVNDAELVTANDDIYWANGICDRTFYDAVSPTPTRSASTRRRSASPTARRWASYLEPTPVRVLVFREAIEFVVSPWANVDDLAR